MQDVRKVVSEWNIALVDEVISNWDEFEKEGVIGKCVLREKASDLARPIGVAVVHVMRDIAFECFRRKAMINEDKPLHCPGCNGDHL